MYSCGFSLSNFIRNIFLIIFNFRNRFPQIHFIDMFSSFYFLNFSFSLFSSLFPLSSFSFVISFYLVYYTFEISFFIKFSIFFSIFDIHFITINLKITSEISFFVKKYFLSLLRFEPKILRFAIQAPYYLDYRHFLRTMFLIFVFNSTNLISTDESNNIPRS